MFKSHTAWSASSQKNRRRTLSVAYYLISCFAPHFNLKTVTAALAFQCSSNSPSRHINAVRLASSSGSDNMEQSFSSEPSRVEDPLVELGLPSPLILGSGSFTRKLILGEMGIPYHLLVKPIDEKNIGDRSGDPRSLVLTLAKAKGDHLVSAIMNNEEGMNLPESQFSRTGSIGGWVVLTADQVVTHDGVILEKPESVEEAKDFVSRYAVSAPSTVGACVLTHVPSLVQVSGVDSARINFQPSVANVDLVGRLLKDSAPVLSCAGGLMVEHPLVREHLDGIDGTEDSVMGLSKDLVMRLLREMKEHLKKLP